LDGSQNGIRKNKGEKSDPNQPCRRRCKKRVDVPGRAKGAHLEGRVNFANISVDCREEGMGKRDWGSRHRGKDEGEKAPLDYGPRKKTIFCTATARELQNSLKKKKTKEGGGR